MNDSHAEQPLDHLAAEKFRAMAARIETNFGGSFGGAVVIAAPDGDATEMFILDSSQNTAMFWSNIKSIAEIKLAELSNKDQQLRGLGYR